MEVQTDRQAKSPPEERFEKPNFVKLALIFFLGIAILSGALYGAYLYSQSKSGNIILPGGVTYTGPSPKPTGISKPLPTQTPPPRFTAASDVLWSLRSGNIYPYTFYHPETLTLISFEEDKTDAVAISWEDIPSQKNILLNIEIISDRDPKYLNLEKIECVRNWHQFFSGIIDTEVVEPFRNTQGLYGYRAKYINTIGEAPNVDVFFEVPDDPNIMIHLANGMLDLKIFDKIVDSVKWQPSIKRQDN